MSELYQSLSHSKWDCKYHVIFVPKSRCKAMFLELRQYLGSIFHELARQKECRIIEGYLLWDHVHICIEIPPKYVVSSVTGFLKGKSAYAFSGAKLCAIVWRFKGKQRNYEGENFWARGYAVSTVGFEEAIIQNYIGEQEASDQSGRF
jgi:putative transposase